MKVSIIGGGGRVGSNAAFALQLGGIVKEVVINDMNAELAEGEALDLRHGSALTSSQIIRSGDYTAIDGSDCVVITAGLRRKPDESRLELINRNVTLFKDIVANVKKLRLPETATILVVSNPVDILTQLAVEEAGLPESQVLGLGTVLDTCRFRSLLADNFNVGATDIDAVILGEHGDSMVPIWSSATIGGVHISSLPGWSQQKGDEIFDATKKSGASVIALKGGAGWAVGVSIKEVVEAIALDSERILPVSSLQKGAMGISGVCLSLPTRVGRAGVVKVFEPAVSDDERTKLLASRDALKSVWDQVSAPA
jgi:L-lactate dehydrogenase